jgi:hypothetical protein
VPSGPPRDRFVFGDPLRAAADSEPAAWLAEAVVGPFGSVGGLVPGHYESYLVVDSAQDDEVDWWDAQRERVAALAEVLTAFTATPDAAWFALWEGHGWDSLDALREIPRFDRPERRYLLVSGRVADVERITWPGEPDEPRGWFRPDLWWPQDRQWFVGTDVDFWCNYVGGSEALTDAITARLPGVCHRASLEDALRTEA